MDNPNTITIPAALIAAREAVEGAEARRKSLRQAAGQFAATAAGHKARIADLDTEIARLHGDLLADAALAGVDGAGERISAADRRRAEMQLAERRAERAGLPQKIAEAEAAAAALGPHAAACEADLIAAGRVFLRERSAIFQGLDVAFRRDVGRLPLPEVFKKWFAIASALGYQGCLDNMHKWRIEFGGPACFYEGRIVDDAGDRIDLRASWREDAELAVLNRTLAELLAVERRIKPLISAHDQREKRQAEIERLAAPPPRPALREMQDLGPVYKPAAPTGPGMPWGGSWSGTTT